jgi:hypothetical protein
MNRRSKLAVVMAALSAATLTSGNAAAIAAPSSPDAFAGAAREFGVPEDLLKAYSLSLTGGVDHGSAPSAEGGFGLMHLTSADRVAEAGRGADTPGRTQQLAADPSMNTLTRAAALLGQSPAELRSDPAQNVRGGAAVLADEAKQEGLTPAALGDWFPVVSRLTDAPGSTTVAEDVFTKLRQGAAGGRLRVAARGDVRFPQRAPSGGAECPRTLACRFLPAAYATNNPADANAYGNYDLANRPSKDQPIKYIVIHDTEESYASALATFQNPAAYTSAHYVIRSSDGEVTQMVRTKDVAWHAASNMVNAQSIGIEHEGVAVDGAQWYTDAMYRSSATLVRYLAARFHIPLDREHIIGHNDVANTRNLRGSHWDPGPFWDWNRYMRMLGAPTPRPGGGRLVAISPHFASNQPALQYCAGGTCAPVPAQPTNEVLLRTEPRDDAPLLTDTVITAQGTNDITDWSNKAVTGRQYAVAERRGRWTAIWFAGQKAWLHSAVLRPVAGRMIRPKPGVQVQVFASAFPEASEWPAGAPAGNPTTPPSNIASYTISGDQRYSLSSTHQAAVYYARFADDHVPYDQTVIRGAQTFYLISFHHRFMYVKADDVLVS